MTSIPEDIMLEAEGVASFVLRNIDGQDFRTEVLVIASAILAERERCAQIAESHMAAADNAFDERIRRARHGEKNLELAASAGAGMSHSARKIAAAIRKGDNHE